MTTPHLQARRDRAAKAIDDAGLGDAIVLIGAGEPISVPGGQDRVHPFQTHHDYFWLAGQECAGAVLAFDPSSGWDHFSPPVTDARRIWEGDVSYDGEPIERLDAWLASRAGRPVAMLGVGLADVVPDAELSERVESHVLHARRFKDDAEIAAMKEAVRETAAGFARFREVLRPGVSERTLKLEIEHAFRMAGAQDPGYDTIVGAGPNAAVFHFEPGQRTVGADEFVLLDAGASHGRYTADVTRVLCAGTPSQGKRELLDVVIRVQQEAVAACVTGSEFVDMHRQAGRALADGLVQMGVLKGDPADLEERGVVALFFPHGLGHLVGLGVRDATGSEPGRAHRTVPGGVRPRLDARLQPSWIVTIEPGCYFVPALLDDAEHRSRFADAIDFDTVAKLRDDVPGIRIEDDILVTERDPVNLTVEITKEP